ncbi:hypothetical protein DY000_02035214 [Brassica cretica]|uniref:Uncharacterized protein n=1 Tax=Brassica cretica TaxID=69181 RepID=A0ABQ7DL29_BRACR|nr:hypothetical protein DY000_02035214 [Brassica cretica]
MEVLRDLSGTFMSDEQREQVLSQVLKEAGYTNDSFLTLEDFIKDSDAGSCFLNLECPHRSLGVVNRRWTLKFLWIKLNIKGLCFANRVNPDGEEGDSAVANVVTVAELLKNNGFTLGKSEKFGELMSAAANEENEAAEAQLQR